MIGFIGAAGVGRGGTVRVGCGAAVAAIALAVMVASITGPAVAETSLAIAPRAAEHVGGVAVGKACKATLHAAAACDAATRTGALRQPSWSAEARASAWSKMTRGTADSQQRARMSP
jgi:hypothetical protein